MNSESDYRIYAGSRTISSATPMILVTAERTSTTEAIAEYFVITANPKLDLRAELELPVIPGPTQRDELELVIREGLQFARHALEHAIHDLDRSLHWNLYADKPAFEFSEQSQRAARSAFTGSFRTALQPVVAATKNSKLGSEARRTRP